MKRRRVHPRYTARVSTFCLVNAPLVIAWWWLSSPGASRQANTPAMFLLLILALITMVALPLCVPSIRRKRWLLLGLLACINLYWCLEWITCFARSYPGDSRYAIVRLVIPVLMLVSSLLIAMLYVVVDSLLGRGQTEEA